MEKVNDPENSILYLIRRYLMLQKNKKMFYADYFLIGQMIEVSNPPENIDTYICKEREVKLVRPKYNMPLEIFWGLYKTVRCIIVTEDKEKLL